jgi:SAM-dependent methyltransferase
MWDPTVHTVGSDDGGQRYVKQLALLQHYGLSRSSRILEIGCGIGGLVYELAAFLGDVGTYTGFDISENAIGWLNENYAPHLPNFQFDFLDIENPRFSPGGSSQPQDVRFPYRDHEYDIVCAFEVFMHLPLDGVRNYIREISRVLKPDGRAVLTFNAIWEREREPVLFGRPFVDIGGGLHSRFPERNGLSMAFKVALLRDLFRSSGLEPIDEIEGRWHSPHVARTEGKPVHNCDVFVLELAR